MYPETTCLPRGPKMLYVLALFSHSFWDLLFGRNVRKADSSLRQPAAGRLGMTSPFCPCEEDGPRLKIAASFHGLEHGDFVGVFEIGTDGNAHANARDAHAEGLEQFGKIHGGGFAFGSRIRGDDDLFD
jgi:hypothetical protein